MSSVKHAVEMMKFAHGMLDKMLETIPDDKCVHQQHPTSNHVAWTLGHMASTYAWLATTIDANAASGGTGAFALPESYAKLFGGGSKPSANMKDYPPLAESRKRYNEAFAAYLKMVEGLSEKDAWSPCAIETGGFASSKIDGAYKCAWHDGWHLGQIADLRRALGLPPIM
jgi:hypothetical protein